MSAVEKILQFVNEIREEKSLDRVESINPDTNLRDDLALQSLDLASLTVMIEDEFEVDVFEDGLVFTVGEIIQKIER